MILKYDFSDVKIKKEAQLNQVLNEFSKFAKERHGIDVSESEAESALYAFFRNHDLDILFASQEATTLLPSGKAS